MFHVETRVSDFKRFKNSYPYNILAALRPKADLNRPVAGPKVNRPAAGGHIHGHFAGIYTHAHTKAVDIDTYTVHTLVTVVQLLADDHEPSVRRRGKGGRYTGAAHTHKSISVTSFVGRNIEIFCRF